MFDFVFSSFGSLVAFTFANGIEILVNELFGVTTFNHFPSSTPLDNGVDGTLQFVSLIIT